MDDVLYIAGLESSDTPPALGPVDINVCCMQCIQTVRDYSLRKLDIRFEPECAQLPVNTSCLLLSKALTELLRKEGYERLEEEILYLFFLGVWQNDLRHGRAVARAIEQERMDVYELWKRCDRDVSFRREFIRHLATYLEPLTVELPNL